MERNLKIPMIIAMILLFGAIVSASMLIPVSDEAKEHAKAPEKSSVITETEAGEWEIDRIDFIHYAKPGNPVKPPKVPGENTCYKLIGVKWKPLPVNYIINPSNPEGLSEDFVINTISASAESWDDSTSSELFNAPGIDYSAKYGVQNFKNAVVFDNYPDSNVIGVTSIWYMRKGRQIVEFDILLNTDFAWGDAESNSELMDLQNIATHELGHAVGMNDIYTETCNQVTMYGYSEEGETIKRTLEQPDITGLQKMYGI